MRFSVVGRVLAAVLILVVGAGGSGLPVLDALVFHGSGRPADSFRPHYEATSACHGDGCSLRSLAQSRFGGALARHSLVVLPSDAAQAVAPDLPAAPAALPLRYLSRAPPLFV